MIRSQLRHILLARHHNGYGIHSPYLYHLVTHVLFNKNRYYCFDSIESLFPAPEKEHAIGQAIFRLAEDINASTLVACCDANSIDLAYLTSVKSEARLFCLLDTEEMRQSIDTMATIDLAVFGRCTDADKLTAVLEQCIEHTQDKSVFVVKNIHSKQMEQRWYSIIKHPKVRASLDIFHYGILLFNPDLEKRQYIIRQ